MAQQDHLPSHTIHYSTGMQTASTAASLHLVPVERDGIDARLLCLGAALEAAHETCTGLEQHLSTLRRPQPPQDKDEAGGGTAECLSPAEVTLEHHIAMVDALIARLNSLQLSLAV